MAKKKSKKKIVKLTNPVKTLPKETGDELPNKRIQKNEDKQLLWFFIVIGIIFATVLISYFWVEGAKSFEYGEVDWTIEDYENLRIYHGRFMALSEANLNYNIYLRGDPRENDVPTEGAFDKFKYGGVVSMTPEIDNCRGELARVMIDLGAFLRRGVGVGPLESGSTDRFVAIETDRRFAQCTTVLNGTLVIIEKGEARVVQNENYPYCYTIYVNDCNDITSVEKFIVKTIEDFTHAKEALENSR